jgi:hypothetical protein
MDRVLNTFIRQADGRLVNTSYRVVENSKGNAHFPDQTLVLAVEKDLDEYHKSFINAGSGDSIMVAIKNDKKAKLCESLTQLADYVNSVCKGDKAKLLSSGFQLAATKNGKVLSSINAMEVEIGPPGEATTRVKRVAGARAYIHRYTTEMPTTETRWIEKMTTAPICKFTGLQSAVKYWFCVIAIGLKDQSAASPVVTRIIQ